MGALGIIVFDFCKGEASDFILVILAYCFHLSVFLQAGFIIYQKLANLRDPVQIFVKSKGM